MDSNIGKKLDGRYELLELIGVGGMADIYRARDIEEDRIVAVKILKTEFAGSDEFLRRFRNESKAIALLSHQNIVKIYDVGFTEKVQFIVMEYVDGITLTDYIEQQGLLKWRDAVHFTVQILRALQHAHDRGIVHRDIKSSNIMLLRDGTIKVMDFGIARFNRENNKTVSEKTIGSVHYISPEQARGDITDERSDIYSVGVLLYEMLTGKKPFDGDTPVAIALKHMQSTPKKPTEITETIPEGLEQIVMRAMQKEPGQRYQTAGEMIKDLEDFKKNPGIIFEYKYNSTDGTTKYFDRPVPAAEQEKLRRRKEQAYDEPEDEEYDDDDDEDEYEERRSPLIPILFAVGTAFIIATVFLVLTLVSQRLGVTESDFTSVLSLPGSSSDPVSVTEGDEFEMPNLLGMQWEDALVEYSRYINLVAQEEYSEVTKGEIFEQDKAESRRVKVGSTVTVKVSKGLKMVEIQDFTNRTIDAAEKQLRKDGFTVQKKFDESDEVTKDYVIRTIPEAHEQAPQGSTVVVFVSLGPTDAMMLVPSFLDMPIEQAIKLCNDYYLIPKVKYEDNEEVEKDVVMAQSIPKNTQVERDTEIELTVSTGELPMQDASIVIPIPKKSEGKFTFEYYLDGIIDEEATEVRDISLTVNKEIRYTAKGKIGEEKNFAVFVESDETGKRGLYLEAVITFADPRPSIKETSRNSKVFAELLEAESEPEPETSEPDTVEPGTVESEGTETPQTSEPVPETTPAPVTEPPVTTTKPEESEPEPDTSETNLGGIPVE